MPHLDVALFASASATSSATAEVGDGAVEHFTSQLQALLPSGLAWIREGTANLTLLLRALGLSYERAEKSLQGLLDEADPRTTTGLLSDWERIVGQDDPPATIAARRAAVAARLSARGGQSEGAFVELAAQLGYAITIERFTPFVAGTQVGRALTQGGWIFVWDVVTSSGMADAELETIFRANAPAHTLVRFRYE